MEIHLREEERDSDISSQNSPRTERSSAEVRSTLVRLDSPSVSSNFLTVSFARRAEHISLRVVQPGEAAGGRKTEQNI